MPDIGSVEELRICFYSPLLAKYALPVSTHEVNTSWYRTFCRINYCNIAAAVSTFNVN